MKNRIPLGRIVLILSGFLIETLACHRSQPEFQTVAEHFVISYYLHSNSKEALLFSHGPAAEKLNREVQLLAGVEPAGAAERPQMSSKVLPCQKLDADSVECAYELQIHDVKTRIRRGKLSLEKTEAHWWVTDYVEAEYNDS